MRVKRKYWLGLGVLVVLVLIGSACLLLWPPSLTAEEQHLVGQWKMESNSAIPVSPDSELRWRLGSDKRWTAWTVNSKTGARSRSAFDFRWSIQNGELVHEMVQSFPAMFLQKPPTAKYSISSPTDDTTELTLVAPAGYKVVLHRISEE